MDVAKCKKCGSKVFVVDETASYIEVDGEIVKKVGSGDLHNRNCVRCTYPEEYEEYKYLDEL
jgi:predicted nucleic-acid-binding Zn-ribbon protein